MSQSPPPILPPAPLSYSPPSASGPRTSGVAIASLVFGVLGCVPIVTSLIALVLGWIGIRKTRNPQVGGRGLAISGFVLGLVGIACWTLFAGILIAAFIASKPARVTANQFAIDISSGNINAAVAASTGMSAQELTGVSDQLKPWGTVTETRFLGFNTRMNVDGTAICELNGTATFSIGGPKTYTVTLVKRNNVYVVQSFNFK